MDELKFGQTVYTVERHCNNHSRNIVYGRKYTYSNRVMMRRIVNFDDKQVCLEPSVFMKREEIFITRKEAEKELTRKNQAELEASLHISKKQKETLRNIINKGKKNG